ncbi:hypothetical protein ACM66B_002124 [Microbotryomycetes sp. NB124-2]
MPLVEGRLVPVLKGPSDANVPSCVRVHRIEATGETFFHEAPYMHRLHYLRQPIFECRATGTTGLDYFAALESEKRAAEREQTRLAHENFPDELKARVLGTAQFQIAPRLDMLCDDVHERYENRFFVGEKVFVDLGGDKYFSRIAKVFPPREVRALARPEAFPPPSLPGTGTVVYDEFARVSHAWGINLGVDTADANLHDPADDYLYTVQLMLGEGKFEGSFMELKASKLSRDRTVFTKTILRRFLRDCLQRSTARNAPWLVKPDLARAYHIPMLQTHADRARLVQMAESRNAKRRIPPAPPPDVERRLSDVKRPRLDSTAAVSPVTFARERSSSSFQQHSSASRVAPAATTARRESATRASAVGIPIPTQVKYPIEDTDLVRLQVSSRIVRRSTLSRPSPNRSVPVSQDVFARFVCVWANVSVFANCLGVSLFTLDDLADALKHSTAEPPCRLLVEVHASLTNIIGSDSSRVYGTSGAPSIQALQKVEVDQMEIDELEDSDDGVANGHGRSNGSGEGTNKMTASEEHEMNVLLRRGIRYSKRWEKSAKLKASDERKGWMRHVVGALCQRGGPRVMPNLGRILEHLFQPVLQPEDQRTFTRSRRSSTHSTQVDEHDELADEADTDLSDETGDPEASYYTLSVEDKVDILQFLCSLMLGSKVARSFIEEGESRLTELRRARADWNKQSKMALIGRKIENGSTTNGPHEPAQDNAMESGASTTSSPAKQRDSPVQERRPSVFTLPSAPAANGSLTQPQPTSEDAYSDWIKREMRRWHGVARCRPLGQDRFFCKFWWLDGLGSMSLSSTDDDVETGEPSGVDAGAKIDQWHAGRLLVQGPSREELEWIEEQLGKDSQVGVESQDLDRTLILGVDEWGFIDENDQLENLICWLDAKGAREKELKAALMAHRTEMVATFQQRHEQQQTRVQKAQTESGPASAARRSTRNKEDAIVDQDQPYLAWTNELAKS